MMPELKHRGEMFSPTGSNVAERRERIAAVNRDWNHHGGFRLSKAGWRPRTLFWRLRPQRGHVEASATTTRRRIT
eukprot:4444270-Pyramimonas_sp.AAC.1